MGNPLNLAPLAATTVLVAGALVGGCAFTSPQPAQPPTSTMPPAAKTTTLQGTVVYRERMALPGKVIVKVTLEDVSLADAPSKLIAQQVLTSPAGPPYSYSLTVDNAKILPTSRYTLRASITADGRLMFSSTEQFPVFNGSPTNNIEILTRRTRM
ncbi:MAG: YbaY family lipoprotein [Planctomycetota bacterium]|nr:YbaY family lipoprotein [Planctomycetota bacterium]